MNDLIDKLGECVEFGKINQASPYPPAMKGMPGADELTKEALEKGCSPQVILNDALIPAMNRVGNKFTEGKIFVPQMLLSAKAMNSAMKHFRRPVADGSSGMRLHDWRIKDSPVPLYGRGNLYDVISCLSAGGRLFGGVCGRVNRLGNGRKCHGPNSN